MVAKYPCSQSHLYEAAKQVATSLNTDLASFSAFSSKYNPTYVQDLKQSIVDAYHMPDDQSRNAEYQILRDSLSAIASQILQSWQSLKCFIEDAYSKWVLLWHTIIRCLALWAIGLISKRLALFFLVILRNIYNFVAN